MKISTLYVRFYRSFNFDYLRKFHPESKSLPWELLESGLWYPYVRVPIERSITTIVGANESGKSHLLSAIEAALTGEGFSFSDFCRYSQFFVVNEAMRLPDFGFEFVEVSPAAAQEVAACCAGEPPTEFERFAIFRSEGELTVYVIVGTNWAPFVVKPESSETIRALLPHSFRIDASIPLPDSASIRALATGRGGTGSTAPSRQQRSSLMSILYDNYGAWFSTQQTVTEHAADIFTSATCAPSATDVTQAELADDLLVKIAKVERQAFSDLETALREGNDGYANGIIDQVNRSLAAALNLKRWWTQDDEFKLLVSPREFDLAFTVRDRTGTDYSFGERSTGLKYFLSYLVQYLAHDAAQDRPELLLMDEPDAYLSSQGQQDLLRVLEAFANDEDHGDARQVVYVTHSPFLIDKNHAERIRVIEKGSGDEGTRVVKRAGRNHYEPLRSAFGSFIGETTFIGNCNLMIEGESDQVLLAGMSTHIRAAGGPEGDSVDLNKVTLVHAGGAPHIPYMVFLARGRDVDRPAVIVLLDNDRAGTRERKRIKEGGPKKTPMLDDKFVYQLGERELIFATERSGTTVTIEDLLPLEICAEAAAVYASEFLYGDGGVYPTAETIRKADLSKGHLTATEEAFKAALGDDFHLDKVGFARSAIQVIARARTEDAVIAEAAAVATTNFRALFQVLNQMNRAALREYRDERVTVRIVRSIASFLGDHKASATNEQALVLFEDIESVLDNTVEADAVRLRLREIARDFSLENDPTGAVTDFARFSEALRSVRYAGIQKVEEDDVDLAGAETGETTEIVEAVPMKP